MNKLIWLSLVLVAVLSIPVSQAAARGGHGGGGHHGGGHRGGGHHAGHHSHSHHHTGHHTHTHSHHGSHYHHSNWAHHNRPFSRGWYGRHGGNWGYGWGGWGWGNPWGIATFGATAAWLGLEGAEPIYGNYGTVDNVLTSDTTEEPAITEPANTDESIDDSQATEDTDETSAEEAPNNAGAPRISPEQIAAARQLIDQGKNDPAKDTAFLPLGVFSIAPQGQREANALVQLAVSKAGQIRGTYYDLLTDKDQPIRGAVNKKTQQVAFTFGDNGKVTFETALGNLTQEKGPIAAHFENGQTSTWTLARYAKEPTGEEAGNTDEPRETTPAAETAPQ